jgi:hypothetical protein
LKAVRRATGRSSWIGKRPDRLTLRIMACSSGSRYPLMGTHVVLEPDFRCPTARSRSISHANQFPIIPEMIISNSASCTKIRKHKLSHAAGVPSSRKLPRRSSARQRARASHVQPLTIIRPTWRRHSAALLEADVNGDPLKSPILAVGSPKSPSLLLSRTTLPATSASASFKPAAVACSPVVNVNVNVYTLSSFVLGTGTACSVSCGSTMITSSELVKCAEAKLSGPGSGSIGLA